MRPSAQGVLKYSGELSRSRFIFTDSCCTCTPIQSVVDRFIASKRQPCILQLGGTGGGGFDDGHGPYSIWSVNCQIWPSAFSLDPEPW